MSAKKKRKKSTNKIPNLSESILKILLLNPSNSFNYKQIGAKMGLDDPSSRNQIIKKLKELLGKQQIEEIDKGKYRIKKGNQYHTGKLDMTTRGQGYVVVEGLEDDVFVSNKNINKAFNGDEVEVYIYKRRKNSKLEGEITNILKRNKTEFVGVIDIQQKFAFVSTADGKMYTDIFVSKDKIGNAQQGDKVLVRMDEWPEKADSPFGTVIKVLGKPGEHNTEIHSILAQYGLPHDFAPEIEKFAENIDTKIHPEEVKKRRDMRKVLTFTIDPADAKDFDDALSFQVLENGNYEVGIHIADVSHYLQPNTILDDEAYERATSVYLVDRVVPMLPEVLSNFACSLRPNEEKFTFSAVFEINEKAQIKNEWFGRTVTLSDARFAYEEAQQIIETGKGEISAEFSLTGKTYHAKETIVDAVKTLNKLAKTMRRKRMQNGAISFDKVEVKFKLDEENNPTGVYFKESKEANHLIEEFMLLANKKVAEFIGKQTPKKTFVYRVHDEPNDEKLSALEGIIKRFGYKINTRDRKTTNASLNKLLVDVKGKKEQNLIDTLAIRTMSKAEYSTQNIGHYGLAFDYYSHFTSPIRRYPDVMVHRLLQIYLDGKPTQKEEVYEEKCRHSSDMEGLATSAERDSIKYMQVKYMVDHKDEQFLGVISGVTEWGIYVEIIENKCEGMVSLRELRDDHYTFDRDQYAVVGSKTKKVYQLGDEVFVKVKQADLVKKQLDFTLIGSREEVEK
ncbi:ribonuclease R [Planktosalinus lacus]|uniref:Ribonuclease R n=1 Tax=Planktosalinus lacus TaxID=1526573 RepID=A0A8J2Y661_9FLAO|nr:ribonuclease R [Planktosalinus lacus]GGD80317.1 ribonuclease R [Planktosalinus lacus]